MIELIKDGATNNPSAAVCLPAQPCDRQRHDEGNPRTLSEGKYRSHRLHDPGASNVNQLNRIKLMMATAHKNLREESAEGDERLHERHRRACDRLKDKSALNETCDFYAHMALTHERHFARCFCRDSGNIA